MEHDGGIGAEWEQVGTGSVVVRTTGNHMIRLNQHRDEGDVTVHFVAESVGTTGQPLTVAAGQGIIYAIDQNDDLLWFHHDGRNDGSFSWAFSEGKKVGVGWGNFKHVFSGGDGIIYAITPRVEATLPTGITIDGRPTGGRPASGGDLMWYRHDGRNDGSFSWAFSEGKKVGTGWFSFKQIFSD